MIDAPHHHCQVIEAGIGERGRRGVGKRSGSKKVRSEESVRKRLTLTTATNGKDKVRVLDKKKSALRMMMMLVVVVK